MEWTAAINLKDLQQSSRQTTTIDGNKILFIMHEDKVHAVESQCPHLKMPLTKGKITEDCAIVCPFHKSSFDLKTGDVKCWSPWPPVIGILLCKLSKKRKLKVYPTKVENDQIFVKLG